MLATLLFTGAVVCLANLLGLALFATIVRRQLDHQKENLQRTRQDFQSAVNEILDRYRELRERLEEEPAAAPAPQHDFQPVLAATPAVVRVPGGMNLTKRVQILRLHRRGENTSHIASALGVPQREVELVIKLHAASAAS